MSISSSIRKVGPFVGAGTTTIFPFAFKVFAETDLVVTKLTVATGVEVVLVLNTDYTVLLNADQNGNPGGSITLPAVLATGFDLTISTSISNLQPVALTNQGGFFPSVINDALDRSTIQIQQLQEKADRSLRLPTTDSAISVDLPSKAQRLGTVLAFNETTGQPMAGPSIASVGTVAGNISAIQTDATNISSINTVAANITNVNTTGSNIASVNTAATNIASINTAATNIAAIIDAPNQATIAATQAGIATADRVTIEAAIAELPPGGTISNAASVTYAPSGTGAVATTVQAKLRESVSVKDFGATSGGTALANTTAIQAAIDYAAPLGMSVFIPAGIYAVTTLTLPQQHGGIHIFGEAYNSLYNLSIGTYRGTNLVSTTTTGHVLSCDGGGFYSNRGIRIENLSIVAATSGDLIRLIGSPNNTQINNVTGRQNGAGGGFYFNNCWSGLSVSGCAIEGGASSGTGITLLNEISAGQYYFGNGTQVNGFDFGVNLGTSGTTIYNILIENCAIQVQRTNAIRLGSVSAVTIQNTHFEFVVGAAIAKTSFGSATTVNIKGNTFYRNGTTSEISLNAGLEYSLGWNIVGNMFQGIDDGVTAIKGSNAAFNSGKIADNYFIGYAGTTEGINLGVVAAPNWVVENNEFSSVTTPVGNSTLLGSYIQKNGNYSAITTTGIKTTSGSLSSIASGVATTVYVIPSAGLYKIHAYQFGGSAAAFTASATVHSTGSGYKITAINGTNMTLTLSGANIQVTQTLGSPITVSYTILRIV